MLLPPKTLLLLRTSQLQMSAQWKKQLLSKLLPLPKLQQKVNSRSQLNIWLLPKLSLKLLLPRLLLLKLLLEVKLK